MSLLGSSKTTTYTSLVNESIKHAWFIDAINAQMIHSSYDFYETHNMNQT